MKGRFPAVDLACERLAGAVPQQVARTAQGPCSAVYRAVLADGRRVVVKLFAVTSAHGAQGEARIMRAVAASGRIAVPRVVGVGRLPGLSVTALVSEDAGTRTLGDLVRAQLVSPGRALGRLGGLLSAFHRLAPPADVAMAPGALAQASSVVARCPAPIVARIEPALAVIADRCTGTEGFVWCHGDLHWDNTIPAAGGPQHLVGARVPGHFC